METDTRRKWSAGILVCLFFVLWNFWPYLGDVSAATQSKGIQVVIKDASGRKMGLYKGSHALLIGVSEYTAGWPKLHSVPQELDRVEAALEKRGFQVVKVWIPPQRS